MATPALSRFGSPELKREFLAPSVAGDIVACLGVSEVGSGSDVASIKTTAVPKKGQLFAQRTFEGVAFYQGTQALTFLLYEAWEPRSKTSLLVDERYI